MNSFCCTDSLCTETECILPINTNTNDEDGLDTEVLRGEYEFSFALHERGVYSLAVWTCPQSEPELCDTVNDDLVVGNAVVTFTVCQENSFIPGRLPFVEGQHLDECKCEAGYYGDNGGFPRLCVACDAGKYASTDEEDRDGSLSCTLCDPGSSCGCDSDRGMEPGAIMPGSFYSNSQSCGLPGGKPACTQCELCSAGYYQSNGNNHC